jgi:WD40 repeat protein
MVGLAVAGYVMTGSRVKIHTFAASPDGNWVAVGGEDGRIRVFDPATGKRRQTVTVGPPTRPVQCLALSPDGGRLVAIRVDDAAAKTWTGTVVVADLRSGEVVWERPTERGYATHGVSWSPVGDLVAWGDGAGVTVADAGTGQARFSIPLPKGGGAVAFSPNGRRLATGGRLPEVRVWDVETRTEVFVLTGHQDLVTSVAWSPDGDRLASGGGIVHRRSGKGRTSGDLMLWDARTGKAIAAVPDSHEGYVMGIAFDRGGRLTSVSGHGTLKLWDGHTGKLKADLTALCKDISGEGVTWAADGRLVVAMGEVLVLDPGAGVVTRRFRLTPE